MTATAVDAYLARLGVARPVAPTMDTLHALHLAHLERIPFENADVLAAVATEDGWATLDGRRLRVTERGLDPVDRVLDDAELATALDRWFGIVPGAV